MKRPFSDNVVFVDTEFSSLNPYVGEIISIGIVKGNGEELYLELEYSGEIDDWVKENVFPSLKGQRIKREEAAKMIKNFIGNKKPRVVSYVDNFDIAYLCKLFGVDVYDDMFYWITVDFASILFGCGTNPDILSDRSNENEFFKKFGIDPLKYVEHNALDDAKLLREVYLKFFEDMGKEK